MVDDTSKSRRMWENVESQREKFVRKSIETKQKIGDHLINTILSRRLFKYQTADLLVYFTSCVCLRSMRTLKEARKFTM